MPNPPLSDNSLAARLQAYAREALEREIGDISEEAYAAGWMGGIEFELWRIVQAGAGDYGMMEITPAIVAKLRQLAEDAGGWLAWSDKAKDSVFVPMAEWLAAYDAAQTKGAGEPPTA